MFRQLCTKNSFLVTILVIISYFKTFNCLQYELSILVEAGKRECFHQYLIKGLNMETDYQVIQGGELDVTFWISSPQNQILFNEMRKNGGQTQFKTELDGEYAFCFDNSFSRFADKQVFFYISSTDTFEDPTFLSGNVKAMMDKLAKDQLGELEDKLEVFRQQFGRVVANLEKAQRIQNIFKAYEMIDRSLMEHNFERVNFWSVINIILMVSIGFLQVFMIRSLFEDKSKIGKVLRGNRND